MFVEETARLLEYESGGILVAIERVPKGFVLIFYRGKNYRRPISLRPRNLLTKAKALKRRVALQRYEVFLKFISKYSLKRILLTCVNIIVQALSQHISELEKTIEQTRKDIVSGSYHPKKIVKLEFFLHLNMTLILVYSITPPLSWLTPFHTGNCLQSDPKDVENSDHAQFNDDSDFTEVRYPFFSHKFYSC